MTDLARIKRNVQKMVDKGAPVEDIDGYIASEGVSIEQVRAFKPSGHMQGEGASGTAGDILSRANDALLSGAGEEFRAGVKALPALMPGGESFMDAYRSNLGVENTRRARIQEERPVVDVVGQTLGLGAQLGTGVALQGANMIPQAANSAMGRIAQAGGTGAVVGGVSGLADTESDMGIGMRGLFGMGVGGGVGVGLGGAVEGVSKLVTRLLTRTNAGDKAASRVARRMSDQGVTPDQALASKREAARQGIDDYALIDVGGRNANAGTQLQRLGRNVADQPGEGSAILDDFVTGRQAGQYDRFMGSVNRNVSPVVAKDDIKLALKDAAQRAARPLYERGAQDVVKVSRTLKMDLSKPSVRQAWQRAARLAAEDNLQLEPLFIDGKFNPKIEQISGRTAHYVRQALDDLIDGQTTVLPNGAKEMTNLGRAYTATRRHIDNALKSASAAFREGDAIYEKMNLFKGAIESGSKYAQKTPDQLAGTMSRMTPQSRAMYRLGAAWDMARKLGQVRDGRDLTKAFMASPADRQRLAVLAGSQRNLDNMLSTLRSEREMSSSFGKITGGSRTSAQMADQAQEGMRGVTEAIRSGPYQGLKNAVARIVESMDGMSAAERKAIADILTTTDDAGFAELMAVITQKQAQVAGQAQLQGAIEQAGTLQLSRQR